MMNKLIHHGVQLEIQMESYEVFLKSEIESYIIWGNIILDVNKHLTMADAIELEFSGVSETFWPQGTSNDL